MPKFPKEIYVAVVTDTSGKVRRPMELVAFTTPEETVDACEDAEVVGVYALVGLKRAKLTRELV